MSLPSRLADLTLGGDLRVGCRSLDWGGSLRPGPLTIFTCKTESRISAFKSKGLAVLDYEQGAMQGGEGRARERGKRGGGAGFSPWCKMSEVWALEMETPEIRSCLPHYLSE